MHVGSKSHSQHNDWIQTLIERDQEPTTQFVDDNFIHAVAK